MLAKSCLFAVVIAALLLPAVSWAGGGKVTGARMDELDLYEDESLTTSRTVEASKLGFPLAIEDSNAKAVKISYQGHAYWVIRSMVDTEGLDSTLRRESVDTQDLGASRGLGRTK